MKNGFLGRAFRCKSSLPMVAAGFSLQSLTQNYLKISKKKEADFSIDLLSYLLKTD